MWGLLIWGSTALAWDSIGATWPESAIPIPWYLGSIGQQEEAELQPAIQAAFDTWAEVECAGLRFSYMGRDEDAVFGGPVDGRNTVSFVEQGWPEDMTLVTSPSLYTAGAELVEADFAFNGQGFRWRVDGADGATWMDVQAGATHEIGHMLGLWHSEVEGASLHPSMEADDVEGLCSLYLGAGGGELGEACLESGDCAVGLECLVDGGSRYCTTACAEPEDCPADMDCAPLGEADYCAFPAEAKACGCSSEGGAPLVSALPLVLLALRRRGRPCTDLRDRRATVEQGRGLEDGDCPGAAAR
jgi:hypothetical protein